MVKKKDPKCPHMVKQFAEALNILSEPEYIKQAQKAITAKDIDGFNSLCLEANISEEVILYVREFAMNYTNILRWPF